MKVVANIINPHTGKSFDIERQIITSAGFSPTLPYYHRTMIKFKGELNTMGYRVNSCKVTTNLYETIVQDR